MKPTPSRWHLLKSGPRIERARLATKLRRRRGRPRDLALVVAATFLVLATLASLLNFYRPALLWEAGRFVWSIKSSVIELGFAIVAARISKRH